MRSAHRHDRVTTVDRPLWAIPLSMLLTGLLAVTIGAVGAVTANRSGSAAADRAVRITGTGLLQQRPDGPIVLCAGTAGVTQPASCGTTISVTGVSWRDVPGAALHAGITEGWATLTGTWGDDILRVDTVEPAEAIALAPARRIPDQLCVEPGGTPPPDGHSSGPDPAMMESLPGYQGHWVTDGGTPSGGDGTVSVHNVAVRGNVPQAERLIRESFSGPLCVGTLPGATHAELTAAMARLTPQFAGLGLLSGTPSLAGGWAGLNLQVFVATPEVRAQIDDVLGPEVSRWTTVRGQFRVVG